ncbi:MAG: 2-amino-4-hydroxy-6-hydroxymethyldihydropteridine diphosphokinase [Flavobacteriales bacterium]
MAKAEKYVLLTGSDLGNRLQILNEALALIEEKVGSILKVSTVLESEPWGFKAETRFLNQAVLVETTLTAFELLDSILEIENSLGRTRVSKEWTSRLIDIDILCSEHAVVASDRLTIPHKHLHERLFALNPLNEVVNWMHPVLKKTYAELKLALEVEPESEALVI